MQFIFVHLKSIKQIHRNEDTISMQSAFSFLNDSDHKNNNTFFFFLWKPLKAEGEQSMQHCTHLHSIFYPACLVECYTYSNYRSKNRKGQISRKHEFVVLGFFWGVCVFLISKGSNVFTSVTLNWVPVRLEVALPCCHWEPVWVRNRDLLGSEKPKVRSVQFEWLFSSSFFTPLFLQAYIQFAFCLILFLCCSCTTSLTFSLPAEENRACFKCKYTLGLSMHSWSLLSFTF